MISLLYTSENGCLWVSNWVSGSSNINVIQPEQSCWPVLVIVVMSVSWVSCLSNHTHVQVPKSWSHGSCHSQHTIWLQQIWKPSQNGHHEFCALHWKLWGLWRWAIANWDGVETKWRKIGNTISWERMTLRFAHGVPTLLWHSNIGWHSNTPWRCLLVVGVFDTGWVATWKCDETAWMMILSREAKWLDMHLWFFVIGWQLFLAIITHTVIIDDITVPSGIDEKGQFVTPSGHTARQTAKFIHIIICRLGHHCSVHVSWS